MLEVDHRQGRARSCVWTPSEGVSATTPNVVFPEVSFASVPDWAKITIAEEPAGREGVVELLSGGTWFHPKNEGALGLVVAAPQPAPTSLVQMLDVGSELSVMHDAGGWASNPTRFVEAFIEARRGATPGRLLWAPALGVPSDYALFAYLGVDLFDASPLYMAAARGEALTVDGPLSLEAAATILGDGTPWDTDRLVAWNVEAAHRELLLVRHAIQQGTLRALVERRVYADPEKVALLRRFDREHGFLAAAAPRHDNRAVPCMTPEALTMPEVVAFREQFKASYAPAADADVLVLLPCSARKPYKTSKTHRYFARALDDSGIRYRCHEVMVTSPLGIVPRELEEVYPAHLYDVPVTGRWSADEEELIREQVAALLSKHDYAHVVVHTDQKTFDAVRDLLPEDVHHTAKGRPSSIEECTRLRDALRHIRDTDRRTGDVKQMTAVRRRQDMRAVASFQFGEAVADEMTKDCTVRGRTPYLKLLAADGTQIGTTIEGRGFLSLTLAGASILARHGVKRVHIEDFKIKNTGSLFAVGVQEADMDIRVGDEVVLVHGDEIRGSGQALMSAEEMTHLKRGIAVQVRHRP